MTQEVDNNPQDDENKIPVNIITGFLGSVIFILFTNCNSNEAFSLKTRNIFLSTFY